MRSGIIGPSSIIDPSSIRGSLGGYGSLLSGAPGEAPDVTTDDYAATQETVNARKTLDYLLPRARALQARRVLDVGCGVGMMVKTFQEQGYEAYGADLPGLHRHWQRLQLSPQRMFIVDPGELRLPFFDGVIDFAFTLGAIEHVGTTNGHSDRRPDYHAVRRQWLREVYRVVRPGGAMLVGGPNRQFPVDAAHGLDSRASSLEHWLSRCLKVSVHRTWGGNFLWAYADVDRYLAGLPHAVQPQSIDGFLDFGRVPGAVQGLARWYVRQLPRALWGTGFNPWVMALVIKPS
jgi:SAM-dependent methyltransferase